MHSISLISIKFIFVFLPKSGVSHILCVTFIYLIQFRLILPQTFNCHVFICIIEALATHFQHETKFSKHLAMR